MLVRLRLGFPPSCQQMGAPAQTGFPEGVQAHPSQASAPRRGRPAPLYVTTCLQMQQPGLRGGGALAGPGLGGALAGVGPRGGAPRWPRLLLELLFSITALQKWGRIWEQDRASPRPASLCHFPAPTAALLSSACVTRAPSFAVLQVSSHLFTALPISQMERLRLLWPTCVCPW